MEKLYHDYLPLVKSIASKYKNKYKDLNIPFEDLVQEGFLGILEAEKRFDASKGIKFSTYAFYWIKKKILEAIQIEKRQFLNSFELNEDIVSENDLVVGEIKNKENSLFHHIFEKELSPLEQKIFTLFFQEQKTLSEISKELGIRRERIRQLKELILRKIKINQKLTKHLYAINNQNV